MDKVSWEVGVRRALHQSESMEFESLLNLLSNIFLCRDAVDICIWKPNSIGSFSSKSFYRKLDPFGKMRFSCMSVWMGLAHPPKV